MPQFLLFLVLMSLSEFCLSEEANLEEYIRAQYTKHEYQIPMRDGIKLFTAVYVPKDPARPYAILLNRTPYGIDPYGADHYPKRLGPSPLFAKSGFVFVYQDVRGRNMSEGRFIEMTPYQPEKGPSHVVDESSDSWDTIDWLIKHIPNNNGRVGMWGVSYPGFYAAAGMCDAHPALKAVSPQAPVADLFMGDDCFHNGAFFLAANFGFFSFFKERGDLPERPVWEAPFDYGTPDAYEFFLKMGPLSNANARYFHSKNPYWNDLMSHTTYDEFWKRRNILPHLKNVPAAVMTVGGWFDAEDLSGPLMVYRSVEEKNPHITNFLVMGPWSHGGWSRGMGEGLGEVSFQSNTAEFFRENIEFPFFNFYLNGQGREDFPEAWVFETGTHQWRRYDSWPPKAAVEKKLYLADNFRLSQEAPKDAEGFDEYISDPDKPVPYLGGIAPGVARDYMIADQRFASRRPDVLTFESQVLESDLSVAGPLEVSLNVSTTGTDADFVVKLIDVYPGDFPNSEMNSKGVRMGGFQQLLRGEPFRAKFRKSFEHPEAMEPMKPSQLQFEMPDICHVFRTGHKVMVQIQSSWFPLIDRNPQTFVDIPSARPEDFKKATQRVYRSSKGPSYISLRILP